MNKRKLIIAVAAVMLAAYASFCAAVRLKPQWFFYNPDVTKADINQPLSYGLKLQEVSYTTFDGLNLYGWIKAPRRGQKMIVFYHGNSHNIGRFYNKLKPLADEGYGVFMPEYRGFGGNDGEITQAGFEQDALAAVDYLHRLGYKNRQIVLYGMSLGSYTSSYAAANSDGGRFAGLILEVPFDSLLNVVRQRIWPVFPFQLLIKDQYDNLLNLAKLQIPLLVMAARNDTTVPLQRAQELFAQALEPKELIIYDNAEHSELVEHSNWRDILRWLKHLK
ncbi:MAG: alpha/beta fold hydrolase [Alphaproteobacteria bacterium]|nr:alpha/beta fold hydrolase [Alphaproteobacteria bacterium]